MHSWLEKKREAARAILFNAKLVIARYKRSVVNTQILRKPPPG